MAGVATSEGGIQGTISVPDRKLEISASDESVKRITLAVERMWYSWLAWTEHNPAKFYFVCACILTIILEIIWGRVSTKKQKAQYVTQRGRGKT